MRLFHASAALLLLTACSGQPETPSESGTNTVQQSPATETKPDAPVITLPKSVKLSGKFLREADFGTPQYLVELNVDGNIRTIDTVAACETIPKETYGEYDIPKEALSACGGWWAGGGDYYYAIILDNKVAVYQGWQDEGQEDNGYHWKRMKKVR